MGSQRTVGKSSIMSDPHDTREFSAGVRRADVVADGVQRFAPIHWPSKIRIIINKRIKLGCKWTLFGENLNFKFE